MINQGMLEERTNLHFLQRLCKSSAERRFPEIEDISPVGFVNCIVKLDLESIFGCQGKAILTCLPQPWFCWMNRTSCPSRQIERHVNVDGRDISLRVYVETPLHPEKLTVWGALWAGGIIGPYFFKNNEGHNVPVNGDRYRAMITNFFIPELNNHDVQELWFQQDGATCHTARATIDLLKDKFGDRLISRFGPVNWPPRSCDLTPLDYFLWGYVKSLVYADKPQTLDHLEDNIRRVIADIRPQMLEKVIENWTSRLDYIRASRGSPMPEIIFKM
ncbi:putative transposable element [Trichonephila clavipes]|nr:putative transposable element [Trichonephila clavipes]